MPRTIEEAREITRLRVKKHREARPDLEKARQTRSYIKFLEREGYIITPPENPIHELYARRGK